MVDLVTNPITSETSAIPEGSDIASQMELGNVPATPQESAKYQENEQFGHRPLTTAGLGLADTLSFGTSKYLMAKAGLLDPANADKIQELNSNEYLAGQVAGFIPGAINGTVGKIVGKTGAALLGGAPSLISKVVRPGEELASKIVGNAASKIAGSAVEGMAWGPEHSISEALLGDPNITAESVLSDMGYGTIFGAGVGSLVEIGRHFLPASLNKMSDAIKSTRDYFIGSGEGGEVGVLGEKAADIFSKTSGIDKDIIKTAISNRALAGSLSEQELKNIVQQDAKKLNELHDSTQKSLLEAHSDIRPAELEKLVDTVPIAPIQQQLYNIGKFSDEMLGKFSLYPERYSKAFVSFAKQFDKDFRESLSAAKSNSDAYNAVNTFKQNIQGILKHNPFAPAEEGLAQNEVRELSKFLRDQTRDENTWGHAGARNADFNDALSGIGRDEVGYYKLISPKGESTEFTKTFMTEDTKSQRLKFDPEKLQNIYNMKDSAKRDKKLELLDKWFESTKSVGDQIKETYASVPNKQLNVPELRETASMINRDIQDSMGKYSSIKNVGKESTGLTSSLGRYSLLGMGASIVGIPTNVVRAIGGTLAIGELAKNPIKLISVLRKLEESTNATMKSIYNGASMLVNASIKSSNVGRGYISAGISNSFRKNDENTYDKRKQSILKMTTDINHFHERLTNSVNGVAEYAPLTSSNIQSVSANGVFFLASKLPQHNDMGPLSKTWVPSKTEISSFNRYYDAVTNPTGVMKQAAAGTLTKEAIEAVSTVYPAIYAEMQKAILEKLVGKKQESIPYQNKMMISMIIGSPMMHSMTQQTISSIQQAFAPIQQMTGSNHVSTPKSVKFSNSSNMMTPMQKSSNR